MARDKALWATIRADFLATGTAYPDLAKKYGVSISTLKKRAAREHWVSDKGAIDAQVQEPQADAEMEPAAEKELEPDAGMEPGTETEPEPDAELEPQAETVPFGALAVVPTDAEIVEAKRERLEKFFQITDGMMDRILEAIQSPDVITPYALKMLASALRDLREMQGLNKSELDEAEQRARIAKLNRESMIAEPSSSSVTVEFVATDGAED